MKRLNIFIIISLSILLLSCSKNEISIGYQPFGSNLPFFVAVEKGFFKEQGLYVKPVKIISANDAANAVVGGSIVANATVPLNVLLNIEENQPGLMKIFMVKATSEDTWSDYLLVKKDSKIDSISDLVGKKIGGYPGTAQQVLIKIILNKSIKDENYTTIEMPPSTQLQGLESGNIDALLTYDELAIIALDNGIAKVLVENPICKYVVNPLYGFPYVISTEYVKKEPENAKKIIQAMYKASDFIKSNDEESRQIMAKWTGSKPEIAAKVNLWDQVKAEDVNKVALQELADIFYKYGIISKRIDTKSLYITLDDLK